MEIQLIMPSPAVDFNSQSTNTTPYATAPSSPQRFPSFFYSAPTSPARTFPLKNPSPTTLPFQKPGFEDEDTDFAFDFTGQLEPPSISAADELFDCGKIKPLEPPPRIHVSNDQPNSFSPPCKKKDFDTFSEALNQTSRDQTQTSQNPSKRGRETTVTTATRGKVSRSSSPFRVSDILSDEENNQRHSTNQSSSLTWYNKWNLKNLLLFRSASEGPLKKYSRMRKGYEDVKNSSFRSRDSWGSAGGSSRKMMRKVSAHEIHYTANRAVAEEMRKKTFLPYKSGLLGCLGFHNNGGSVHEVPRGISSVMKQRGA